MDGFMKTVDEGEKGIKDRRVLLSAFCSRHFFFRSRFSRRTCSARAFLSSSVSGFGSGLAGR